MIPSLSFFRASLCLSFLAASLLSAPARLTPTPATTNATPAKLTLASTNSVADTNSATAELPIPVAIFDLAQKPTHDPFFPLSLRSPTPLATNSAPAFSASDFVLKGLSGGSRNRLALINNRTLAAGESTVFNTSSGRIKIRCLEVKEFSAVILVESQPEPVELFLRKVLQ